MATRISKSLRKTNAGKLKARIERLCDDLKYMEWLGIEAIVEGGEKLIARDIYTSGESVRGN